MAASFRLALVHALRDLRGGGRGLGVFLFSAVASVAMLAAIGALSASVQGAIRASATTLLGGDLEFSAAYTPLSAEQEAFLRSRGTLSRIAELRTMAQGPDGRRTLVELKGVDGAYPLYGALKLAPPVGLSMPECTVAAERTLLDLLSVSVGQALTLGALRCTVSAVLAREPDRAVNAFSLGPRVLISREHFDATRLAMPGALLTHRAKLKLHAGERAETVKEAWHAAFPKANWRIRDYDQAASGMRRFLDNLSVFLGFTGLATLLIAGLGMRHGMESYLATRRTTVAILKATGAPRSHVHSMYIAEMLGVTLLASLAGAAGGWLLHALALTLLSSMLPVETAPSFAVRPLALAVAFGLASAFTFGIGTLYRASAVRPAILLRGGGSADAAGFSRMAAGWSAVGTLMLFVLALAFTANLRLTSVFALGTLAATALLTGTAHTVMTLSRRASTRRRSAVVNLALGNLHRPGAPTPAIVGALGLGATVLVCLALVNVNVRAQVAEGLPRNAPAFFLLDIQPDQLAPLQAGLTPFAAQDFQSQAMVRGRIVGINGAEADPSKIAPGARWALDSDRGFTVADTVPEGTTLVAGSWWKPDYAGPALVSFDASLAEGMGVSVGDTLRFFVLGREFDATIASLREIDWSSLRMNFAVVFSPHALDGAPLTHIATFRVDEPREAEVIRALGRDFPNVSAVRVRDTLAQIAEVFGQISLVVLATALFAIACGIAVMASAVAATLDRRIYDTVLLKVLGARPRDVMRIYALEFGVLALVTAAVALVLGGIAAWWVCRLMMLQAFHLPWNVALATAAGCLVVALGLGMRATQRALNARPLPWLRNE